MGAAPEVERLTFFQRRFTKPIEKDPEKSLRPNNRRFSFLSVGFLSTLAVMLVILFGIIAAAVAVTVDRREHAHKRPSYGTPGQQPPGTVGNPNPGNSPTTDTSPLRMAIYDNFPDPALWYANGTWYAFGTNDASGILNQPHNTTVLNYGKANVQLATSSDFVNWTLQNVEHDPLPITGKWVPQGMTNSTPSIPRGNVWAPGVNQRADGRHVLFYTANAAGVTNPSPHHPPPHCIGASLSRTTSPAGPYDPVNETLACPVDQGGAIDPTAFVDKDGTFYMAYKIDGNNIGNGGVCGNTIKPILPTPIMLQRMQSDGVTADGDPIQLIDRTDDDGPLVEAPQIVRSHEGIYFLFFSSGCTRMPTYDVKWATATSVTGPYTRARYPLLQTGDWGLRAPGSVGIHDDGNGGFNMAFHARVNTTQGGIRAMFTTKLQFSGTDVDMMRDNSTAAETDT